MKKVFKNMSLGLFLAIGLQALFSSQAHAEVLGNKALKHFKQTLEKKVNENTENMEKASQSLKKPPVTPLLVFTFTGIVIGSLIGGVIGTACHIGTLTNTIVKKEISTNGIDFSKIKWTKAHLMLLQKSFISALKTMFATKREILNSLREIGGGLISGACICGFIGFISTFLTNLLMKLRTLRKCEEKASILETEKKEFDKDKKEWKNLIETKNKKNIDNRAEELIKKYGTDEDKKELEKINKKQEKIEDED